MRKALIGTACILLIAGACTKTDERDFVVPRSPEIVIQGKNGIFIIVSDVYSRFSEMKRKIEIHDQQNMEIVTAYMLVSSTDNTKNVYERLKESDSNFSGRFSIEVEGQIIYTREIKNGSFLKGEKIAYKPKAPVYNSKVACTVSMIQDCVAHTVEGMSWWQLTTCGFTPFCYGIIWAKCNYNVC